MKYYIGTKDAISEAFPEIADDYRELPDGRIIYKSTRIPSEKSSGVEEISHDEAIRALRLEEAPEKQPTRPRRKGRTTDEDLPD